MKNEITIKEKNGKRVIQLRGGRPTSKIDDKKTCLAKFLNYGYPIRKINDFRNGVFGLKARNKEQTGSSFINKFAD
jgi:hypothetical protein